MHSSGTHVRDVRTLDHHGATPLHRLLDDGILWRQSSSKKVGTRRPWKVSTSLHTSLRPGSEPWAVGTGFGFRTAWSLRPSWVPPAGRLAQPHVGGADETVYAVFRDASRNCSCVDMHDAREHYDCSRVADGEMPMAAVGNGSCVRDGEEHVGGRRACFVALPARPRRERETHSTQPESIRDHGGAD